jgi:hypothetical protein
VKRIARSCVGLRKLINWTLWRGWPLQNGRRSGNVGAPAILDGHEYRLRFVILSRETQLDSDVRTEDGRWERHLTAIWITNRNRAKYNLRRNCKPPVPLSLLYSPSSPVRHRNILPSYTAAHRTALNAEAVESQETCKYTWSFCNWLCKQLQLIGHHYTHTFGRYKWQHAKQ